MGTSSGKIWDALKPGGCDPEMEYVYCTRPGWVGSKPVLTTSTVNFSPVTKTISTVDSNIPSVDNCSPFLNSSLSRDAVNHTTGTTSAGSSGRYGSSGRGSSVSSVQESVPSSSGSASVVAVTSGNGVPFNVPSTVATCSVTCARVRLERLEKETRVPMTSKSIWLALSRSGTWLGELASGE